jgi:glycosyltransferase involved in cell wall biosynthesis
VTPIVQDIDDLDHMEMRIEKHPKLRVWVAEQFEKLLPRFADQVITASSYLRRLYCGMGISDDRVTWIPNGVNVSEFNVSPDYSIKAKYNLRENVIVYVGSINNEAQLLPLIKAMQSIATRRKDTSCLIIGDGLARRNLEILTHKLGISKRLLFIGKIPHSDVAKFLAISDIGIAYYPSLTWVGAASNIKVFEYMAAGLPVIVSETGDLPYYVDFGAAGVIARTDAEDLLTKLNELLEDDKIRKSLGEKARKRVKENFDWQILTPKLENIYEKLLA